MGIEQKGDASATGSVTFIILSRNSRLFLPTSHHGGDLAESLRDLLLPHLLLLLPRELASAVASRLSEVSSGCCADHPESIPAPDREEGPLFNRAYIHDGL